MKKKLNVLSIDFDFFQIVTKETMTSHYPDGHDLSTDLSSFVWASHYADEHVGKLLQEVIPNQTMINEIKQIIENNATFEPISMICNSHKHIYRLILDNYDDTIYDGVNIVNIDMHHDMFDNSAELDCGNWVGHVINDIPNTNVTWIANPISIPSFGDSLKELCAVEHNFDSIKDMSFDIIFLCRSDIWSPPHLDSHFESLTECIINSYENVLVEPCVLKPRSIEEYVEQMRKTNEQMKQRFRQSQ